MVAACNFESLRVYSKDGLRVRVRKAYVTLVQMAVNFTGKKVVRIVGQCLSTKSLLAK